MTFGNTSDHCEGRRLGGEIRKYVGAIPVNREPEVLPFDPCAVSLQKLEVLRCLRKASVSHAPGVARIVYTIEVASIDIKANDGPRRPELYDTPIHLLAPKPV